jgi:hypothetical protein
MSDRSKKKCFKPWPVEKGACAHCGEPFQIAAGAFHDDRGHLRVLYIAPLAPPGHPREARMFLVFDDQKRGKRRLHLVTVLLSLKKGDVVAAVVTDTLNPLGHAMTREQVLARGLEPLALETAEFVLDNDPLLRPYFEKATTTRSRKGT